MFSKNNENHPKMEREYFDKPVGYHTEGFMFIPLHKKPFEYSGIARNSLKKAGLDSLDNSPGIRSQSTAVSGNLTFTSGFNT